MINFKKILAIGAHPDDIEHGCGQFLYSQLVKGADVEFFVATRGEGNGNGDERVQEQINVVRALNILPHVRGASSLSGASFMFRDRFISSEEVRALSVLEEKVSGKDLVLCHYPNDTHQDHRCLGTLILSACRYTKNLLFYRAYSSIDFNPKVFHNFQESEMREPGGKLWQLNHHHSQVENYSVHKFPMERATTTFAWMDGQTCKSSDGCSEGFIPHVLHI